MKTTIDLDERKLRSVMKLKGLRTRKAAIDYALTEAERRAKLDSVAGRPWTAAESRGMYPADYDVIERRSAERRVR